MGELDWDVEVPGRSGRGVGVPRGRGTLRISTEDHGDEALSIPVAVARSLAARKESGELRPLTRAELLYRLRERSLAIAWQRAASLVNRRDYSRKELADKLRGDGYRQDVAEEVVERASRAGLVDDRRFADVFVRTKVSAGWGMLRIARELGQRGIDPDELPGWPYEYLDPDDEASRAVAVASRHHVSGKNQLQKLVRFLVGRGFSTGVAYDAARVALEASGDV